MIQRIILRISVNTTNGIPMNAHRTQGKIRKEKGKLEKKKRESGVPIKQIIKWQSQALTYQ